MAEQIAIVGRDWDIVDLIETINGRECVGFIDPQTKGDQELVTLGADSDWATIVSAMPNLRVLLAIDSGKLRHHISPIYKGSIASIVSPSAFVSPRSHLGHGYIIQRGVHISARVTIGDYCKLNINSTLHHDVTIGNFCTLAPGCQLLGNVAVSDYAYIGAGSIIKQHCRIGRGAIVGAGAVVVKDVPDGVTVVGVPATILREPSEIKS